MVLDLSAKKMVCVFLAVFLCVAGASVCLGETESTISLSMTEGESYAVDEELAGVWDCTDLSVVTVEDNKILALEAGDASLIMISDSGNITYFDVHVEKYVETGELKVGAEVPAEIAEAIRFTLNEWQENLGVTFSRLGSKNKYAYWQCGSGSGCNIGWCGAFVGYCLDNSGIPMDDYQSSVPHEDGRPYSVRAAGVGKIYTGFQNMNRLSDVPRPGYLVIYGKKGGYAYLHVGLVTGVKELEEGKYLVQTVEGNVSNRIKRYCYLYVRDGGKNNYQVCPEEYQLSPDTFGKYQKHDKNWMITTFCQTWF